MDHTETGGTKDNPVVIEEAPVIISNDVSKRQKFELKVSFCVSLFLFFLCVHLTAIDR